MRKYAGYRIVNLFVEPFGVRLGFTADVLGREACPYLRRWILWLGFFTLRYHVFLRGDNDRALHDHPWWFVTVPLDTYIEEIESDICHCGEPLHSHNYFTGCNSPSPVNIYREVRRWRPHFRSSLHRHRVHIEETSRVRTLVLTGRKRRTWGFWDHERQSVFGGPMFVDFKSWFETEGVAACQDPHPTEQDGWAADDHPSME